MSFGRKKDILQKRTSIVIYMFI
ncbi:hypothetical protein KSF78_0002824 [Schistosoma japonicum]|nr:hypothetical protein KSF78_0002824 [Schistosoma japonicum]